MIKKHKRLRVAIINDTRPTRHYGCALVMRNLINLLSNRSVDVAWTWPVGVDWRLQKEKLINLEPVDGIIVNGEGSIHHSGIRSRANALGEFAKFAKEALGAPAFLINATLCHNEPQLYKSLKDYAEIFVRDNASLQELNRYGLYSRMAPDLTFAFPKEHDKKEEKDLICATDSVLEEKSSLLKYFCQKNGWHYRPMQYPKFPTMNCLLKKPVKFIENTTSWACYKLTSSPNPEYFIDQTLRYKMVVTGRYHAVTICIANRIPFLAIESNTPKITYLLNDVFGGCSRLLPVNKLEKTNFEAFTPYSAFESGEIDNYILQSQILIKDMIDSLVEEIDNSFKLRVI